MEGKGIVLAVLLCLSLAAFVPTALAEVGLTCVENPCYSPPAWGYGTGGACGPKTHPCMI